jgi:hypothetical protein
MLDKNHWRTMCVETVHGHPTSPGRINADADRGIIHIWDHQCEPTRLHLPSMLNALQVSKHIVSYISSPERGRFFVIADFPCAGAIYDWFPDEGRLIGELREFLLQVPRTDHQLPIIHTGCAPALRGVIDTLLAEVLQATAKVYSLKTGRSGRRSVLISLPRAITAKIFSML